MNKTTKTILGVVIVIIAAFLVWYGVSKKPQAPVSKEPIKIGAILPLSGSAAAYGNQIKNGIDLAVKEINDPRIIVLYEDSKCDPKEGVTVYNKLVNVESTKIIIADFCSSVTVALIPLVQNDQVLAITPGAAAKKISGSGIFRNHITMDQKTGLLGKFASKKFKRVAILYDQSAEAFIDAKNAFTKNYLEVPGNEIVTTETFKQGDADFKTQLLKIKYFNPEAIYVGSYGKEGALIVKQIKELGIKAQILTDDWLLDPKVFSTIKDLAEGIIFGTTKFDKDSSPEFWNLYKSNFGEEPSIFSAQGYDTVKIIYSIIKEKCNNGNPQCIKNELYKVKDYPGVSGRASFNQNGDALKEVVLKIVRNGQFVPYEE
jgi:branched-chain amino acid transport system substrate-binding protein